MFGDYRDRPFFDLTGRISAAAPPRVVDMGCGPGNLTATLAHRWPQAEVIGIDSSEEMIARAKAADDAPSNLSFEHADAAEWSADGVDVLISNAALQWVPGHRPLLEAWLQQLRPGGWLALQVPGNFGSPSHALMRELTQSTRWQKQLGSVLRHDDAVEEPHGYLQLMLDGGCRADAWETTYLQMLPGEHAVLEWVRGTALRPVIAALDAEDARSFEAEYSQLLDEAYPPGPHGTEFPFRRTFCVGQKID